MCVNVLYNPRKRVKLKEELFSKVQEIVSSENIDPEGFLCNDTCYRSVDKYYKLKNSLQELKKKMEENFDNTAKKQGVRWKRGVPTDVVNLDEKAAVKLSRPTFVPTAREGYPSSYPIIPRIIIPDTVTFSPSITSINPETAEPMPIEVVLNEQTPVCKVEVRIKLNQVNLK